jgi:hypothetical protein
MTGPASAFAESAPTVSSLTLRESGSNGGVKFKIIGTEFNGAITPGGVKFADINCKKVATITGKCQFKVLSNTEIEVENPLHEHGKVAVTVTNSAGSSGSEHETTPADEFSYFWEQYRNEAATAVGARVPAIGYGQLMISPERVNMVVECLSVGIGVGWNEFESTELHEQGTEHGPAMAHGQVEMWSGAGHLPSEEHTEISSGCRFIYEGTQYTESKEAWFSPEPPLAYTEQQGEVCKNKELRELSECPKRVGEAGAERELTSVVEGLHREPKSVPWNFEYTEREGHLRAVVGLPDECKGKTGAERTELGRCPHASEQEAGKNPERCRTVQPAPPGCIRVTMMNDIGALAFPETTNSYEGSLEPLAVAGSNNGLSPSSWEFQGAGKEQCLQTTANRDFACVTGAMKVLGYNGQELISVK